VRERGRQARLTHEDGVHPKGNRGCYLVGCALAFASSCVRHANLDSRTRKGLTPALSGPLLPPVKGPDTSTCDASQSHGDADLERSMRVTNICLIANVVLNALGCLVTLLSLWPSGMPAQKVLSKAPCACRRESP
jgi:hypothetical protein